MGGGVPANTTTTTTVNQSPWQNPTYQALMLGTGKNPGPLTNILRNNQGMMTAYNNLLGQGITPADIVNSNKYNPTAGVPGTSFRGAEAAPVEAPQAAAEGGIMNVRKFATGDIINPKDEGPAALTAGQKKSLANIQKIIDRQGKLTPKQQQSYDFLTGKDKAYQAYQTEQTQKKENTAKAQQGLLEQSMGQTAFIQRNPVTGQLESTNPLFNKTVNRVLDAQQMPEQFGQATQAYQNALSGLQGVANYQPQNVSAASVNRGDIRDIAAQLAEVERYKAAEIERTKREQGVTTAAPKSWTDPGVARQYMNPYTQNVLDQELFEANRQAQMRENQQRSQAAQQKAFGGTRAALQESEGRRNLGYLLSDIEQKGLQQAYGQGMGQFQQEQQLGSQVGMSNTQQINQLKSQYMQMGLTEAQANQAALNAASQFNTGAQNLAYNNYVAQQLAAQQANQQMDWNAASQNATLAQQAALANQQAGLQANQQNIGAYGAMGNMAQGLGGLGATQAQTNLANIGALGQAASAWQNLGQQYLNTQATNAQNAINFPSNLYSGALNAINAQPSSGGTNTQVGTSSPASWMGRAEGGAVEAHKAWDKAKGGKTTKKGIASGGW